MQSSRIFSLISCAHGMDSGHATSARSEEKERKKKRYTSTETAKKREGETDGEIQKGSLR